MDRTLLGMLAAFGVALLIVGLTFSRSIDAPANLRFVNGTEPKTLDPQLMTGSPEGRIAEALFEGLTRRDARTMQPAPGMAERWDVSPDGKRYTFHLRNGARWTDGHEVTSGDFVYAWKRLLDPALASEYAYIAFPVRYAEAVNSFDAAAETLSTTIAKALPSLQSDNPTGLEARSFQRFLAQNHVHDLLRHESNTKLAELLTRREGRVTPAELTWFSGAARAASEHLRGDAAEARAHFGVDGGAFAPDPHTLVVELRAPTPYFLELTSFYPLMPVPRWITSDPKRRDDWFLPEHIVSNGPFRLKRWLVNDRLRLERNEAYWGRDEVHASAIDALSTESDTTALNLYLTGAVDWLPSTYPLDLVDAIKERPDFYSNTSLAVYFYRFNTTKPPFDDPRVRQALNLAVDRKLIVEQVLRLGQPPAFTFVPPVAGYHPPGTEISLDVARARKLLAEAGYPEGRGFPEVGILYNTNQSHKKVAEVVADQLRTNLGIAITAYNQEWQSFLDTVRKLDFAMARASWVGDYPDPNTFLDMFVTNGGNNQTGFSSELYDALIAAAADVGAFARHPERLLQRAKYPEDLKRALATIATTTDAGERLRAQAELRMLLFREAEAILVRDEFPILPLYFYVVSGLVAPNVRGFYSTLIFDDGTKGPNLQDVHPLRDLWVDRSSHAGAAR